MGTGLFAWLHALLVTDLLLSYLLSVGVGHLIVKPVSNKMHRWNGTSGELTPWIPMMIGFAERTLVTTLVIWIPASIGAFMGTWFMVKAVGGWQRLTDAGVDLPVDQRAAHAKRNRQMVLGTANSTVETTVESQLSVTVSKGDL